VWLNATPTVRQFSYHCHLAHHLTPLFKVTTVSGDLRNCLDICKRTVELAEKSPTQRQLAIMMQVFKDVLGTDSAQRMRNLPMHQKVALCALHRLNLQDREVTVGKLHAMFRSIATEKRLPTLRQGFFEMLTLMACGGFIDLVAVNRKKTSESREGKVKLRGLADDIKFAFKDDSFITSLLVAPASSVGRMLQDREESTEYDINH
jgi:Cdc6-like AAA superfamily ATPase